jgi:hypothetical protein
MTEDHPADDTALIITSQEICLSAVILASSQAVESPYRIIP